MSFLFLFFLWILWNGRVTLEIAVLGVIICAALYRFISKFMGYGPRTELALLKCAGKALKYLVFLLGEIIKANLDVSKMILAFDTEPEPVLVKFRTKLRSDAGRVLLANSITLTPGSLTVDLDGGEFLIHCLDEEFSEGLAECAFIEKIREMEEAAAKEEGYVP